MQNLGSVLNDKDVTTKEYVDGEIGDLVTTVYVTFDSTFNDIKSIVDAGDLPVLQYTSARRAWYTGYAGGAYMFCAGKDIVRSDVIVYAVSSGGWVGVYYTFQETSFKVTSLSSSSTDTQYPSAKCVYDAIGAIKDLILSNVSASTWTALSVDVTDNGVVIVDHEEFPYKCEIAVTGVTADYIPEVIFAPTESGNGNYSRYAVSGSGTVTIYSKVNTAITIPSILFNRATIAGSLS